MSFIGVPIDSVGRSGGTERGPTALRELGLAAALGGDDEGDLDLRIRGQTRDSETGIVAVAEVLRATETIRATVAEKLGAGVRPFLVGGCCAELPGALAGARDALGAVGLVHFDGHLDLYDGRTSPTGEAADMPISVGLGLGPEAWVETCGGASVAAERAALVGYRDREEAVSHGMRQPEQISPTPLLCPVEQLRAIGPAEAATRITVIIGEQGPYWLHFDVDVLDESVFPATDYLSPGGIDWDDLGAVLAPLLSSPALIGASLACYNPEKDFHRACGEALVESLTVAVRARG
ncbi:MAG TPA: arginase family protein [Solirubrobacterales bacterium]|jgi:arginase